MALQRCHKCERVFEKSRDARLVYLLLRVGLLAARQSLGYESATKRGIAYEKKTELCGAKPKLPDPLTRPLHSWSP